MRARSTARSTPFWTNKSVLAMAGDSDPVEAMTEHARRVALEQIEKGWQGPPFDPVDLAKRLHVPLVPRGELRDARTVPVGDSGVRIEFNPSRPRPRLRFSIAHELAHTFFPDAAQAVRNRGGTGRDDDWQLELLCNIAASELLMPVGSFPELAKAPLEIEALMRLRKRFEVSTEALLRRVVRLSDQPTTFFSASRIDGDKADSRFRLEYWVDSPQWAAPLRLGLRPPANSVLRHCTAVGYTDRATERWSSALEQAKVQCVGVSPYPGQQFPRVVGLLSSPEVHARPSRRIHYVDGDATQPRGDAPRLIAHLVNDKTPNWGGPFARALKERYPQAQAVFRSWVKADSANLKLGNVHFFEIEEENLTVATMVAQHGFGRQPTTRFSYVALRICLDQVSNHARRISATVHMPRIGAGEARGNWEIVSELVSAALIERDVPVTVYTLPGAQFDQSSERTLSLNL